MLRFITPRGQQIIYATGAISSFIGLSYYDYKQTVNDFYKDYEKCLYSAVDKEEYIKDKMIPSGIILPVSLLWPISIPTIFIYKNILPPIENFFADTVYDLFIRKKNEN